MVEISTSLLSADKEKIVETIYDLEMAKTDYFHIDVMDGEFVKNKTQRLSKDFKNEEEVMEIISYAKDKVRRVGIAINPETEIDEIYKFLPYVHLVLVMTVNPGKGGQELITETISKIKQLSEYREINNLNYDIEADGGIKVENSKELIEVGTDILVSGNEIMKSKDYSKTIKMLRQN